MKMLDKAAYEQALYGFSQVARPLEKALYAHFFDREPAAKALDELAAFQNHDGGFGHGLEPDSRLRDSSVIATTIAFQRFYQLNPPATHPMVVNACRYLLNTYDADKLNWPIIPPNIDDAPHAPWWVHGGNLEKSMSNPRAEIAGYLNAYPEHFPTELCEKVTQSVVDYLMSQPETLEMHDLLCYVRFWESPNVPKETRSAVFDKLKRIMDNIVVRSPEQWKQYGLPPLGVISSPGSPFGEGFDEAIQQNLDFIIESQGQDGTWQPNWSWGGMWPEAWEQAKCDWTGVLTLDNLLKLRAFGQIE